MLSCALQIKSERFFLRPLTVGDVSSRYVGWLNDPSTSQFIVGKNTTFSDLERYVSEKCDRTDVIFLGIFELTSGEHLGNIKYELINSHPGYAEMGILIGEADWRGKGVAAEVIASSAAWLRANRNIKTIGLGVDFDNLAGRAAYAKAGFVYSKTETPSGSSRMVLNLHSEKWL